MEDQSQIHFYTDGVDRFSRHTAVLFGAIGHPRFDNDPTAKVRPEQGLLELRKTLDLYANIRPVIAYEDLLNKSSLKKKQIQGTNIVIYRGRVFGVHINSSINFILDIKTR